MNRDDVIRMAREAGLHNGTHWSTIEMRMEHFAALVAAAEREACAKAADDFLTSGRSPLGRKVAEAIRSRGNA